MRDKNKYIDEIVEGRLRASSLNKPSGDFTKHLMQRISAENRSLAEERKSERIVKYAIGTFSLFVIAFTVTLGIISSAGKQDSGDSTGVGFDSIQTSNSLVEQLMFYVQGFFINALNFFGLSLDSGSVNIILIVAVLVGVFLIGERLFLRGKMRSSIQLK
jgi:hypothetical protein